MSANLAPPNGQVIVIAGAQLVSKLADRMSAKRADRQQPEEAPIDSGGTLFKPARRGRTHSYLHK